jgi:hypothetical protein
VTEPQPRGRGRQRKSMLLRLDPRLHDALARWAADELRSTNGHVEYLLQRAVRESGRETARRPDAEPDRNDVT